jgi:hypothetical protein
MQDRVVLDFKVSSRQGGLTNKINGARDSICAGEA